MKIEDIKAGKHYLIDTAPLIASPCSTGRQFVGKVHHVNNGQAYIEHQHGSMLYVYPCWFVKEVEGP